MAIEAFLAGARLLGPLFTTCNALYHAWEITNSFGKEYFQGLWRLETQYSRFQEIGSRQISQFATPIDIDNPQYQNLAAIRGCVEAIRDTFQELDKIRQDLEKGERSVCPSISKKYTCLQKSK